MLAQILRRTLLATLILASSLVAFAMDEGDWWNCNSLMHPLVRVEGVRMPTQFMPLIETPRLLIGRTIPSEGEPGNLHFRPIDPQRPGSLEVLAKDGFRAIGVIHINPFTKGSLDGAHLPLGFNRDAQTRGVGTEAKFAALKYAFEILHVQYVVAMVFDDNYASLALHQKLGFVDDNPGEPHHVRNLTLTAERFEALKNTLGEYDSPMHFFKPRSKTIPVRVQVWKNPEAVQNYFWDFVARYRQELDRGTYSEPERAVREALYRELQPRGILGTLIRRKRSPEAVRSAIRQLSARGEGPDRSDIEWDVWGSLRRLESELFRMTIDEVRQVAVPKDDAEP